MPNRCSYHCYLFQIRIKQSLLLISSSTFLQGICDNKVYSWKVRQRSWCLCCWLPFKKKKPLQQQQVPMTDFSTKIGNILMVPTWWNEMKTQGQWCKQCLKIRLMTTWQQYSRGIHVSHMCIIPPILHTRWLICANVYCVRSWDWSHQWEEHC